MSWRKRPATIKTIKESVLVVFHLGIVDYAGWEAVQRTAFPKDVVDRATIILTRDLSYT